MLIPPRVRRIGGPFPCGRVVLALALTLHVIIVLSLLGQPLDVNRQTPSDRAVVWPLYSDTIHRVGPGADFFALYHAGISFERGESPYGPREDAGATPYFFPFRYLPVVGQTLGRFFILFPRLAAYRIWTLFLETLLAMVLFLIARRFRPGALRTFAIVALLLSTPYFLELHMGQFTFATVALAAIGFLLLEQAAPAAAARGARAVAAAVFSLAVLLKSFPLAAAPALVRHRRFWPSLGLAALLLAATSLPNFLSHPEDWRLYVQTNFGDYVVRHSSNVGFLAFCFIAFRQFGFDPTREEWTEFARDFRLIVLGLTALMVFFSRRRQVLVGSAVLILAHFLTFAHVWEHHMSGVLLVGVLLLLALREPDGDLAPRDSAGGQDGSTLRPRAAGDPPRGDRPRPARAPHALCAGGPRQGPGRLRSVRYLAHGYPRDAGAG